MVQRRPSKDRADLTLNNRCDHLADEGQCLWPHSESQAGVIISPPQSCVLVRWKPNAALTRDHLLPGLLPKFLEKRTSIVILFDGLLLLKSLHPQTCKALEVINTKGMCLCMKKTESLCGRQATDNQTKKKGLVFLRNKRNFCVLTLTILTEGSWPSKQVQKHHFFISPTLSNWATHEGYTLKRYS